MYRYICIYIYIYTHIYYLPCPYILLCSRSIAPNSLYVVCWIDTPSIEYVHFKYFTPMASILSGSGRHFETMVRFESFPVVLAVGSPFNSSPLGQNGRHFTDDIFKCIFMNEKFCILIKISLQFVPKSPIDHKPALVYVMAWRRPGAKPLTEPMLTQFTDAYTRH